MGKKSFALKAVLMFFVLANSIIIPPLSPSYEGGVREVVKWSVVGWSGVAYAEQKRIEAEGIGLAVSKNAPIEIKKQEAFIAAFFDGVRKIAELVGVLKVNSIAKVNEKGEVTSEKIFAAVHERIEDFEVDSQTIIKDLALEADLISVNYKEQRLVLKNSELISPPVEFLEFHKWNNLPKVISGIEVKDSKWNEDESFTVKLAYLYDTTKVKKEKTEIKILGFEFEKDNSGNHIFKTITINGSAYGGGDDAPDAIRKKALDEALRNSVENVNGVFIQSLTEVENFQLTKDEIITQTLGIAKVLDKKFSPKFTSEGNYEIVCTVIAKVPVIRIIAK